MKAVGNLTDFVRDHMLEPFDAAGAVTGIVAHFEDLTKAHEAVQRAQAQLVMLDPLLKELDARRSRATAFDDLLTQAGLDPVETREHFADRQLQIGVAWALSPRRRLPVRPLTACPARKLSLVV